MSPVALPETFYELPLGESEWQEIYIQTFTDIGVWVNSREFGTPVVTKDYFVKDSLQVLDNFDELGAYDAGDGSLYEGPRVYSYRSPETNPMASATLLNFATTDTGHTLKVHMANKDFSHVGLREGIGIAVFIAHYIDGVCYQAGHAFRAWVNKLHKTAGLYGQATVEIEASTVEVWLDGENIRGLPYLLQSAVAGEVGRSVSGGEGSEVGWWEEHPRNEENLPYTLYDTSARGEPYTGHIMQGFGSPFDELDMVEGRFLGLPPANTRHFRPLMSPAHVVEEMFDGHIRASTPDGLLAFSDRFPTTIEVGADGTTTLLQWTLGPGSPHGILAEQTRHGPFLYYVDHLSRLKYILDDCRRLSASGNVRPVSLVIESTEELLGEITIDPPPLTARVGRVVYQNCWPAINNSSGGRYAGDSDANVAERSFFQGSTNMGIYPRVGLSELRGKEINLTQMASQDALAAAKAEWTRATYTMTATISNFHNPLLAIALFNKIVAFKFDDPNRNYFFKDNPVKFRVASVTGELSGIDKPENGGGYLLCQLGLVQVEDRVA